MNLCNEHDTRPRIVFLQGGAHYGTDVQITIQSLIDPSIQAVYDMRVKCSNKFPLLIVVFGLDVQTRSMDAKYPHQSRESTAEFNRRMSAHLQKRYHGDVLFMSFWNLTMDVATSDGFHHLSEANLLKAMYIVNLMELLTSNRTADAT